MNVLLLSLNWGNSDEMGAMTREAMALPLEFAYLSTELGKRGVAHDFVDCWVHNYTMPDIRAQIERADAIVICSSPSYVFWRDGVINIRLVTRTVHAIKEINPSVVIILIGPHGTVVPESFNGLPIDYLFRGEPDLIVPQLIANLRDQVPDGDKLPGVMKRTGDGFVGASRGVEVDNLDDLAPIRLDKFRIADYPHPPVYGAVEPGKLAMLYEASRGCPYSCIYCFKVNFRDKFRAKSLEHIEAELKDLAAHNVGYVYLIDEIFFKDRVWSTGVMALLKKYHIRFGCQTRPILLNTAMVDAIVELGCAGLIQIGLEHTDAEVLKTMRKGDTNMEVLAASLHRLADANIAIDLFLVTGLPGDTREKILAMSDIFESFPMKRINVISHGAMPLPGTRLWEMGIEQGHALKDWDDVTRNKGMIGTKFTDPDEMALASFQLVGRLNAIEDRQTIEAGEGGYYHYLKLAKHTLDHMFPRVMRAATNMKLKWIR
jgi:radical SAM superfamily enzyme YgiQ (UPF0313 family)